MKLGWAVRLYDPRTSSKTINFFSSFEGGHKRPHDTIITYEGIYGLGDYMVWYIHKDIPGNDFSGAEIELKLYLEESFDGHFFTKQYTIIDVRYNGDENKLILFGISKESALLDIEMSDFGITGISYDKNVEGAKLLEDVLQKNQLYTVRFYDNFHKDVVNYKYRTVSIPLDWTVRDFIEYVCDENGYEWTVKNGNLLVGKELPGFEEIKSHKNINPNVDNITETAFFFKYYGDPIPLNTNSNWKKKYRCIWAKHSAGSSGGVTKGCFVEIGDGTVTKEQYFASLEDDIEIQRASKLFREKKRYPSISMASILKDEGDAKEIDEISTQQKASNYTFRHPTDVEFKRKSSYMTKEGVVRSSPYLDNEAGLMFPSPTLEDDPAHSLLHRIEGRDHSPVIGNYVPRKGMTLPTKNKGDFRFRMPIGWDLYIASDGETILTAQDSDVDSLPNREDKMQIYLDPARGWIQIKKNNQNIIEIDEDTINILADGKINISGSGTDIQGGQFNIALEDHKHSYNHKHTVGNLGIAIPPLTTIPGDDMAGSSLDGKTDASDHNSSKTKVDG